MNMILYGMAVFNLFVLIIVVWLAVDSWRSYRIQMESAKYIFDMQMTLYRSQYESLIELLQKRLDDPSER